LWIQSYLSNRRGFSLMEASLMLQFDLIFEWNAYLQALN
jgi:hypothetical protein